MFTWLGFTPKNKLVLIKHSEDKTTFKKWKRVGPTATQLTKSWGDFLVSAPLWYKNHKNNTEPNSMTVWEQIET